MTEINEERVQEAVDAITQLQKDLEPSLKALSVRERRSLPKMGDGSIAFVDKAHEYALSYNELVPSFLDLPQMTQYLKLFYQLQKLSRAINPLAAVINDTMLFAGSGAYTSALAIYRNTKNAKKMNVQNARPIHDTLSQRFASIRRKTSEPEVAEEQAAG